MHLKESLFFLLLFFQSNFFAHPQGLTDAEMTESAYSLRKHAMGLMTVGITPMKTTAMVNLSSWNSWFRRRLHDKRMSLVLKITAKNILWLYEGLFPGTTVENSNTKVTSYHFICIKKRMALCNAPTIALHSRKY